MRFLNVEFLIQFSTLLILALINLKIVFLSALICIESVDYLLTNVKLFFHLNIGKNLSHLLIYRNFFAFIPIKGTKSY